MEICSQLKVLYKIAEISRYNISVFTGDERKFQEALKHFLIPKKILKILTLALCHVDLGFKIFKVRNNDAILIHGFSTEFLFLTIIASGFLKNKVYFLTHHNIQQAYQNHLIRILFKAYADFGCRFIVNEDAGVLKHLGFTEIMVQRHATMLHPILDRLSELSHITELITNGKKKTEKVLIGVIGRIRSGKKIQEIIEPLLSLKNKYNYDVLVGTDDLSSFKGFDSAAIRLVNTSTRPEYIKALSLCDIIILNYDKEKYFYRCSAVAADAVGLKTYVVCPDYPFLRNQLGFPAQVGTVFDHENMEQAIQQALNLVKNSQELEFGEHYSIRSVETISQTLAQEIESNIVGKRKKDD